MSFFHNLLTISGDQFDYGDLEAKYPLETFNQIKTRRESNFAILKSVLESKAYHMPEKRLEVSIPTGQFIQSTSIKIFGRNENTSEIVVYPFLPQTSQQKLINCRYGDIHIASNVTIKSSVKNNFYESYSCILKPSGVTNAVQILGSVRPEFWDEMVPGKVVWYGWQFTPLSGESKIISSVDEGTSTIFLTTNISASVTSDTQGPNVNFGTAFKEDISEVDYVAYGRVWLVATNPYWTYAFYALPPTQFGADYIVTLTNVTFENMANQLVLSMGTAKVNLDNVSFIRGNTPFAFFARSYAGGQTVTVAAGSTLLIEEAGDLIAGSVTSFEPSGNYGAGGYMHDSIIVKCNGTLHLKNNTSASWRQYSSSYGPATGEFSYYASIIEEGSLEYGMLMSNTMPTVIDNITSTGQILMRYDTTINGGDISGQLSVQGTDFGLGNRTVEVNNTTFRNVANFQAFHTGELNNCTYVLPTFATLQVMVTPASNFTINGGEVQNGGGVSEWYPVITAGAEGARLINHGTNYFDDSNTLIDDLAWSAYLNHYLFANNSVQSPYRERNFDVQINNCDIKAVGLAVDGSSVAGSVSKTFSGSNIILRSNVYSSGHQGRGFICNLQGTTGIITKSIIASKAYGVVGTLTNVLEVDWEHDYYETNGTINAIIATSLIASTTSSNPAYSGPIRIYAVGGNITLNTFDATLRPTSNIIGVNGTVITEGNFLDITIDNDYVFETGTSIVTPTVGVGNGSTKIYKGVLADFILDPTVIVNVTAGAINVNADANGIFNSVDVVGIVDYWTGKYEFQFTNNVPNLTNIVVTYNKPNIWKNTGAWII